MMIDGRYRCTLLNADGTVADEWEGHNLITEVGDAHAAERLISDTPDTISYIAIGTGTGQDATSTALNNEVARVAMDSTYPLLGTSGDDNKITCQTTFAAGTGTGTITEFAVFNAASSGTMFNYVTGFEPRVKGATQALVVSCSWRMGTS
jgi:hypothetical protein